MHPGAVESCDETDQDCDGEVDEDPIDATTWSRDDDTDGYGVFDDTVQSCTHPEGYSDVDGDCDDQYAWIHPGAEEYCDGVDNDCNDLVDDGPWYADADGDGYGDPGDSSEVCDVGTHPVDTAGDCDDGDTTLNPDLMASRAGSVTPSLLPATG